MSERMTYEPQEIRDAVDYVRQKTTTVRYTHVGKWRRDFPYFIDEMTKRFEGLKLLMRLLDGNQNVSVGRWFDEASKGNPPPLPEKPYDRMALVWQQMMAAIRQPAKGFFAQGTFVDFPYVIANAFKGQSLGEQFEHWRVDYLEPFLGEIEGWCDRILARLPASGSFDLWDLAVDVVNAPAAAAAVTTAVTEVDDDGGTEPAGALAGKPKAPAKKKGGVKKADATKKKAAAAKRAKS